MERTKSLSAPNRRFVNPACSICEDEGKVAVTLDESIDHEGVDGKLTDGILTLTLKVREAALPRKIAIR